MRHRVCRQFARGWLGALILVGSGGLSACGGEGAQTSSPSPAQTAVQDAPTSAPAERQAGAIVVRVSLADEPPPRTVLEVNKDAAVCGKMEKLSETLIVGPDRGVQNVVAYLTGLSGATPPPVPEHNPSIDQTDCRYEPHVLLVPAGVSVDIKNSDGILHNIHTYSAKNLAFNLAQPRFQKVIQRTFEQPEIIRVSCDVHAWMSAWIVVQDHAYYALTDATGTARIESVPPGAYDLRLWHETLGDQLADTTVVVTAGEESEIVLTLNSPVQASN